ncbi:MAG TPA: peroxiredoxin [Rhodocyclaceae bacterium]|nr:peroxiredoxin [Rhodocyclaceae bacterium]
MKKIFALLTSLLTPPAMAALNVGDVAPDFSTQASLGGKEFTYSLAGALKQGPVVVYFYPAAFTKGCTIEAHNFAEAMPKYKELGASVIGVSNDTIETLNKFSVSECQSKFPVASDSSQAIMKAYDAVLLWKTSYANRTSYVITPDGRIAYRYSDMSPDKHVENTLAAVREWAGTKKQASP